MEKECGWKENHCKVCGLQYCRCNGCEVCKVTNYLPDGRKVCDCEMEKEMQQIKEQGQKVLKGMMEMLKKEYPWVWEHGTCAKDPNPDDKLDAVAYALQHPLYKEAHETWAKVQTEQIKKGAEKYPEPLNDEDYTAEELFFHAVQENVDQMHYLQALRVKNRKIEAEKEKMFKDLVSYEQEIMSLKALVELQEQQLEGVQKDLCEMAAENCKLRKNVMELEEILDDRTKDVKKLHKENEELQKWKTNMLQMIEKIAKDSLKGKGAVK